MFFLIVISSAHSFLFLANIFVYLVLTEWAKLARLELDLIFLYVP